MKNIDDLYELSPLQQGMLFHTLYAPASEAYFEQLLAILSGKLNFPAFVRAWEDIVVRHPALRSSFYWEEIAKPLQMIGKQVDLPWTELDWQHLTLEAQQQQLADLLAKDRQTGFDLSIAPVMRFTMIQLAQQSYQFIWSHHHLLFDGWSMQIILAEVLAYYEAAQRGEQLHLRPAPPYREYINWLQQQDTTQAKQFWQQTLQGFATPTTLSTTKAVGIANEQHFQLSESVTAQLQATARQHHLTVNNLVQGAWALLLARYSGENDVVFGATVSGRSPTIDRVESMVGLLINTIPIRVQVSGTAELLPWLKQLQAQAFEREQYAYFSLAEIQQLSDIPAGMPLFESILVFENYPLDASEPDSKKTLEISDLRCFERTNYPLTLVINPGSQLAGRIVYDTNCFEQQTIDRLIGHFQTLLAGMSANPYQHLAQLSLLSADESEALILQESQQQPADIHYQCIHNLFESQVEKTPDAVAIVFEQQQLTYRELNNRANQLAHYLQTLGVKPEVRVGICVDRSIEMVIVILAILKAGGAYVPLDPAYPSARLALMLADAQPPILLTQTHWQDRLPIDRQTVVNLDSDWEIISQHKIDNLPSEVNPENLAYITYTSGSTGTPKGTKIPHRSIIGFMFGVNYMHLDANQIWLQHSSISWDALTLELWTPLLHGGRCVLYLEKIPTPEGLIQIIQSQKVNILWLTSALFNLIIDTIPQGLLGVKQLLIGGESLSTAHVRRALELLPETQIINGYGPSECTVFNCCYPIPHQLAENVRSIPIGKPIGDRTVYLLDRDLNRVPIGVHGELYVGGASVARGYLNQPTLTREKFIPNPFVEGDTLYKTGDLVRRLPDGNLEFIGRIDTQIKLRGFRIELAEIEAVLSQHPQIDRVVVTLREDEPGHKYLVAYIVAEKNKPTTSTLRNFLKEKLPDYMIPAAFVFLAALPLTLNAKIDRRALPAPDTSHRNLAVEFVAPHTPTEQELATIWTEVLRLEQVGIHDNFFELGGHSLLATQVISRLQEAFSLDFSLRYLFENPTIAELSQKVISEQIEQVENDTLAQILGEVDRLSAVEVSQQLLF